MNKNTILISPINKDIYNFFKNKFNVLSTDTLKDYISYEQCHADMQAININGTIFINSKCHELIAKLNTLDIKHTICNDIGYKYPKNIALNAALIGKKLLCKKNALHPNVREYCSENNIEIINVNQGYTKCSTLILNENSIITDDESITAAAYKNNINVLKIEKGDVILDDNTTGFIGGASAKIGETVYFFGDIQKHRNHREIIDFLNKNDLNFQCVTQEKLVDIGGITLLN